MGLMEYVTDTGGREKVLRLTRNNPGLFGGFFIKGFEGFGDRHRFESPARASPERLTITTRWGGL